MVGVVIYAICWYMSVSMSGNKVAYQFHITWWIGIGLSCYFSTTAFIWFCMFNILSKVQYEMQVHWHVQNYSSISDQERIKLAWNVLRERFILLFIIILIQVFLFNIVLLPPETVVSICSNWL